jgi:glycosyltransferase involved in cell wall biosynthesis
MRVSIVVRTKDEVERLRLTLTSLARQSLPAEVVVVDDGSRDQTPVVLTEASAWLPLHVVRHAEAKGRSGAANAGARAASGDILLFLDGDTLAGPEFVARHAAVHAEKRSIIGRGETFHLRGTRFLQDPETGTPRAGEEARLAAMPPGELARLRVTRNDVIERFDAIDRQATPGIYPGAGPRRLYELEIDALRSHAECGVLWAAASGSNFSVDRELFLSVGGFDEELDLNEHRELALRLCEQGARMTLVAGARTYHMTHRSGWRDPLAQAGWEERFYRAHPVPAVKLLSVFWASLDPRFPIPAEAKVLSLPGLEAAARGDTGIDYEAVRRLIPSLAILPRTPAATAIEAPARVGELARRA